MKTKLCISKTAKISFSVFIILLMIAFVLLFVYGKENLFGTNPEFEHAFGLFAVSTVFSFIAFLFCMTDIYTQTKSNKIIHKRIELFKASNMPCEIQCLPNDKFNIMALNNKTKNWYVFKHKGETYLLNNCGVFSGGEYNDGQFLYGCAETLVMDDYYNRLADKAVQNGFTDSGDYNVNNVKLFEDCLFLVSINDKWFVSNTKAILPIDSQIARDIIDKNTSLKTVFQKELQRMFGNHQH